MKLESTKPESKKVIDLLFKQFYSGSQNATTGYDESIVRDFLTSENYVKAGEPKCYELLSDKYIYHPTQSLTITISQVETIKPSSRIFEILENIFAHSGIKLQKGHILLDWQCRNLLVKSILVIQFITFILCRSYDIKSLIW